MDAAASHQRVSYALDLETGCYVHMTSAAVLKAAPRGSRCSVVQMVVAAVRISLVCERCRDRK